MPLPSCAAPRRHRPPNLSQAGTHKFKSVETLRPIIDRAVSQVFAIQLVDLSQQTRGVAKVALARQVAMYLAHVSVGLNFTQIGELFERDRTTVAHACGVIEDRRDDPLFDTVLELLECAVLNMLQFRGQPQESQDHGAQ